VLFPDQSEPLRVDGLRILPHGSQQAGNPITIKAVVYDQLGKANALQTGCGQYFGALSRALETVKFGEKVRDKAVNALFSLVRDIRAD
jgi:hypothetical protein